MSHIRAASSADVLSLPAIEAAADEAFRSIGMPEVADSSLPSTEQLASHATDSRVWVATVDGDVVAYALAVVLDGNAHLEQVSVHPDRAGQRIGADLINTVSRWARDRGDEQLTLTTFVNVPWNAPYYEKLGFHPLEDGVLGPELAAELCEERVRFAAPRMAMARLV